MGGGEKMFKRRILFCLIAFCGMLFAQEQTSQEQTSQGQASQEQVTQEQASPDAKQFEANVSTQQTSKKVLFERARDVLKESLQNGDKAQAKQAFEYLQANVRDGAPLLRFEEYLIYMELEEYEKGIQTYAGERRLLLDTLYKPEKDYRVKIEDGLSLYLRRNFNPFTAEKADSLVAHVDSTNISDDYKDLYAALIYSEVTVGMHVIEFGGRNHFFNSIDDTTRAENFLVRASRYAGYYPQKVEYMFLTEQTLPFIQNFMTKQRDFRANPLKHKYYTSGFGFSIGKTFTGLYGDAADYISTKASTFGGLSSNGAFDIYMRIKRLYIGFYDFYGMINKFNCNEMDEIDDYETVSRGLNIGFNVFDSRFLRMEPFVGIGGIDMGSLKESFNGWDVDVTSPTTFNLGLNADVRLLTTYPNRIGEMDYAILLHFRYMVQFGSVDYERTSWRFDYEDSKFSSKFMTHTFNFAIAFEIW